RRSLMASISRFAMRRSPFASASSRAVQCLFRSSRAGPFSAGGAALGGDPGSGAAARGGDAASVTAETEHTIRMSVKRARWLTDPLVASAIFVTCGGGWTQEPDCLTSSSATRYRRPVRSFWPGLVGLALCGGALTGAYFYPRSIAPVPPASLSALRPGAAGTPLVRHAVVLVADGARRDVLEEVLRARPGGQALLQRA